MHQLLVLLGIAASCCTMVWSLSPPVQELSDDYWNWRMRDMPEFATFVGFHDYNEYLDDLSMTAYQYRYDNVTEFMARADELEVTLTDRVDIVNVRVLKDELQTFLDGYPFKMYLIALSNKEGIQVDFLRLLGWMPQETVENFNTMISRLEKVPQQIAQIILLLEQGQAEGIVLHEYSMNKVASQISTFITAQPDDSPIYTSFFASLPADFSDEDIADIQTRAISVIGVQVTPAYLSLLNWISDNYVTRPDIAVTSLPNGDALYAQFIKFCADTDMSPAEIQQIGYDEVDRITVLMQEIVYELGYNMTVQEFSAMITSDPNNYYETGDEMLEGFEYVVYNVTTPALPIVFENIPEAELIVVGDPTSTSALYLSGTYDGSRPGVFYVGTQNTSSQGKFEMLTLSLHEGNPGHHLQGSHAIEDPEMPLYRAFTEDRNYDLAPSRFPLRSYYVEGWALYAENLGFDMDLYGDLYDRYGHYSYEIFRACRLVVDTGLHAFGWTRDEAIDYILAHTAKARVDTENEVDRYITWPGQALAYKIGELQITSFREKAEDELGDLFDIKDFHEVILDSAGPMSIVEEQVDEWIASVLNAQMNHH